MSRRRILRNADTNGVILARVRLCESFLCHLKGLQFVPRLPSDEGLLFVTRSESRTNTTIHMFFMLFSIGVIWLDSEARVVDKQLARPWRPMYAPRAPAQYYLEANVDVLDRVEIGDRLRFDEGAG
ncbi:MAG: DUF192 domain-containing protein [Anaerolineae bacterium]|nr:DUF192 domain-containing protein [Anaerolineae bacterium]NUQ02562.1 DUF192 domain-containing protein [Anaerolineae bacterium]